MRKFIFLLGLVVSVSAKAQTFIGKTEEEIMSIQKKEGNKLTENISDSLINHITFQDNKNPLSYLYMFNKKKICVAYIITTGSKTAKDSIQKHIEKICQEKLTDRSWVQKINGKVYGWNLQGNPPAYSFATSEIKQ